MKTTLGDRLTQLLNPESRENASDTPDFLLATYLLKALEAYELTVRERDRWYGFKPWGERSAAVEVTQVTEGGE